MIEYNIITGYILTVRTNQGNDILILMSGQSFMKFKQVHKRNTDTCFSE